MVRCSSCKQLILLSQVPPSRNRAQLEGSGVAPPKSSVFPGALFSPTILARLVRPLYHRPLRPHWIDPHNRIFPRPEAFDFNFSRAFRKEWIAVDHAVRLACEFVCVGNLGCRTVPNPSACQTRRINSGLHTLPFATSPSASQSQSGLDDKSDHDIYDKAAQSVILLDAINSRACLAN